MQNKLVFSLLMGLCLSTISSAGLAQQTLTISVEPESVSTPTPTPEEAARITQNSLGQAPVGPADC